MDTSLVGVGVAATALGAIFGGIALKVQRAHQAWCARGVRAEGVVSRLAERRGQGLSEDGAGMATGTHMHTVPVVRFRAASGIEYEIDAPEAPMTIGSAVEVAYETEQPSGARAVARTPKVGCALFLIAVGTVLIAIGLTR